MRTRVSALRGSSSRDNTFAFDPFAEGEDRIRRELFFKFGGGPVDRAVLAIEKNVGETALRYRLETAYHIKSAGIVVFKGRDTRKITNAPHRSWGAEFGPPAFEVNPDVGRADLASSGLRKRRSAKDNVHQAA